MKWISLVVLAAVGGVRGLKQSPASVSLEKSVVVEQSEQSELIPVEDVAFTVVQDVMTLNFTLVNKVEYSYNLKRENGLFSESVLKTFEDGQVSTFGFSDSQTQVTATIDFDGTVFGNWLVDGVLYSFKHGKKLESDFGARRLAELKGDTGRYFLKKDSAIKGCEASRPIGAPQSNVNTPTMNEGLGRASGDNLSRIGSCFPASHTPHVFKIGINVDASFVNRFGKQEAIRIVENAVAFANAPLQYQFGVTIQVADFRLYEDSRSAAFKEAFGTCASDISSALFRSSKYAKRLPVTERQLHWHTVTSCFNRFGTVGIAWVNENGCDRFITNNGLMTAVTTYNDDFPRTFTHELGHSIGMKHPTSPPTSFLGIMGYNESPLINGKFLFNSGNTFEACLAFTRFKEGSCKGFEPIASAVCVKSGRVKHAKAAQLCASKGMKLCPASFAGQHKCGAHAWLSDSPCSNANNSNWAVKRNGSKTCRKANKKHASVLCCGA